MAAIYPAVNCSLAWVCVGGGLQFSCNFIALLNAFANAGVFSTQTVAISIASSTTALAATAATAALNGALQAASAAAALAISLSQYGVTCLAGNPLGAQQQILSLQVGIPIRIPCSRYGLVKDIPECFVTDS